MTRTQTFLVTESIADSLAGGILLQEDLSLLSLNSVVNWKKGVDYLNLNAKKALLALDGDEAGIRTTQAMTEFLRLPVEDVSMIYRSSGAKDFYRLLQKTRGGEL